MKKRERERNKKEKVGFKNKMNIFMDRNIEYRVVLKLGRVGFLF